MEFVGKLPEKVLQNYYPFLPPHLLVYTIQLRILRTRVI